MCPITSQVVFINWAITPDDWRRDDANIDLDRSFVPCSRTRVESESLGRKKEKKIVHSSGTDVR